MLLEIQLLKKAEKKLQGKSKENCTEKKKAKEKEKAKEKVRKKDKKKRSNLLKLNLNGEENMLDMQRTHVVLKADIIH